MSAEARGELKLLDRYLLAEPSRRAAAEWSILFAAGIACTLAYAPRIPFQPLSNVLGALLLLTGFYVHYLAHKAHEKAHERYDKVEKLVTNGIYSKIRHPCYASVMLMYVGLALAWGYAYLLALALLLCLLAALTALKEEEVLKKKFGEEYEAYAKRVRWRFVPGLA